MHVFSKTKCIFKYKCMHVYARGYGTNYGVITQNIFNVAVSTSAELKTNKTKL